MNETATELVKTARTLERIARELRVQARGLTGGEAPEGDTEERMDASERSTQNAALSAALRAQNAQEAGESATAPLAELTRLVRNLRMQAHTRKGVGDTAGFERRDAAYRHFNAYLLALKAGPLPVAPVAFAPDAG